MSFCNGQVVKIVNRRSPYFGTNAVILWETPKSALLRILGAEKPFVKRFGYDRNGHVASVTSKYITLYMRKTSFIIVSGKKNKRAAQLNDWQRETMALLQKYKQKTKKQVLAAGKRQ